MIHLNSYKAILRPGWLLIILMIFPATVILIEFYKSHQLNQFFNFWRDFRLIRRRQKEYILKIEKEEISNQTLIGYTHQKPIYVSDDCKHVFVAGTTGSGKTVALANFIQHGIQENYPLLLVDGKGDIGEGSMLEITQEFCKQYKRKLYVINLSKPELSDKYNPFVRASPTSAKDILINLTEWSEEHYKLNTERYLQRLIILMQQAEINLSMKSIIEYMQIDKFQALSSTLMKNEVISKTDHLMNLEICKTSGKISESAVARFSTISESELGQIFDENGIDIYTTMQEHSVILFVLNSLLYPELSPLIGRMVLIDAKQAVSKCFNTDLKRAFFVLDEISSYASTALIDLVNKSRSANITCVLATQSLSDLSFAVNESFKEQVIENTNNYLVLRQNSATNAEAWAGILGTRQSMEVTYQIQQQQRSTSTTGLGSARRIREFLYHPDEIKSLHTGEGFFLSRDEHFHCKLKINKPF